ncbi:MAG: insulinase family protein [Deltaproteobacteria bacterium]|nr:insulinase family protein [Deltaproteobacteria bacterium]
MKRIILFLLAVVFAAPAFGSNRIHELSNKPRDEARLTHIKPVKLKSGMTCYLIQVLDENAVDVSFSIAMESVSGFFSAMSKDKDLALELFFDMLFNPAFDEESFVTVKKRSMDSLVRDNELSGPIAHRKFKELVYGKKNRWGSLPTISTVKGLKRSDVEDFYKQQLFYPDKMIFVMAGDFKKSELIGKLEKLTVSLPLSGGRELKLNKVTVTDEPETGTVKKHFTQSAINIGHSATDRHNPDRYALTILNDIFGGGGSFANRLIDAVRVKAGLAYEVWSLYSLGPDEVPGLFQVHAKTRNEQVSKAVDLMKSEIAKVVAEGVTKEEFEKAKKGILNQIVFEYERPFDIVSAMATFVYLGYPENYVEIFRRKISETTIEDVNNAAKKYLHPDKLKIAIVGGK